MKRIALAAALVVCATSAVAQDAKPAAAPVVDAPKHKCDPKPVFPESTTLRGGEGRRRAFDKDLATYKTCMSAFMEDQKARTFAHQNAYKGAVDDYNATMKEVNAAIERSREANAATSQ